MERPQGPSLSAGSTASLSALRSGSTLRIRIQDAQSKDTRLASSVRAPTSAPTLASPSRSTVDAQSRRPRSGPSGGVQPLLEDLGVDDDVDQVDHRSVAGSVSRQSRAASSAMVSSTSTALRAAAIATLERAIGRELPVQVRAKVRHVAALDDEEDDDAARQDKALPVDEGDETNEVPLPHVVLSAADVRAIKDSDTLKFLHENSLGFLRYVGDAPANPPVREQLSSSTGPRSASRNGLRDAPPPRRHGAEDIRALTQALCDDIATFITTVDNAGQEYVIATDKATGQVIVPVDVDGGDEGQTDDVGFIGDLEGFDDDDAVQPDGNSTEAQLPELQADDDDQAAVASSFAEVLVKMRRDRLANLRAEQREEEATEVQRRLDEIDVKLGITPQATEPAVPEEDIDDLAEGSRPSAGVTSASTSKSVSFRTGWSHGGGANVPTPPRPEQRDKANNAVAVQEVKLFQPSTRPPPNRRIEAMLKLTTKDSRPNYMKATTTSTLAKGKSTEQQPVPSEATPKAPSKAKKVSGQDDEYKSGFSKPAEAMPADDSDAVLQIASGPHEASVDDVQVSPRGAAATKPVIRAARPQLTQRMEHRIDWLLENDDYESMAPAPDAAAGDDDAPTVDAEDNVHRLPIRSAYQLPSRVRDIDAMLEAFARERGGAGLPTPQLDSVEDDVVDPMAIENAKRLLAALDNDDAQVDRDQSSAVVPAQSPPAVTKPETQLQATRQPETLAAEMALQQALRAKALGTQYMREVKEQRETRKAMNRLNERLSALSSEMESLYSAPFSMNREYHMHQDPDMWRWPGEEPRRPADAARPTSSATQRTLDALVKPPTQSAIDRLVEEARREQMRSKWVKPQ